jgi:hypothetical protein
MRLALLGLAHLALGWAATLLAPLWVLLLAPLLFGVPHVVNDLRLLVLKPPAPVANQLLLVIAVPLVAMTLLRASLLLGAPRFPVLEVALGFLAVLGAAWVASKERGPLRGWLLLGIAVLGILCASQPSLCALALGHGHNLVAVALWLSFMRRAKVSFRVSAALAGLFLALGAVLLLGLVPHGSSSPVAGLGFAGLRETLAPGLTPGAGDRVVMSFAFAQLMHYSIWVFLLPACTRSTRGDHGRRSLPQIWRDLTAELGQTGVALAALGFIALPLLGMLDATGARSAYLSIVLFHGWLEIALITYWLGGRREAAAR